MNSWIEFINRIPPIADIASFLFLAPAILLLWFHRHKIFSRHLLWASTGILVLLFLHTFGNILERSNITDALDYSGLLLDVFFFFTLFVFSQDQATRKLQESEQQLRASNQQLQASEQQLRAANQQLQASEQQLRAANERYRHRENLLSSIFRAVPTGIGLVIDRDLKQANERLCEMTGYSRDELIGQNARMLYPTQEVYECVGREKYHQIEDKGTGTIETCWQTKNGRIIDVLLSFTPLDTQDLSKGVTFTALDITTRKEAEEALRESESKLREAQQMAHLGHWFWDVKTGQVEWSDEVYIIFRLDPQEFTPQIDSIMELSPWPEDNQRDKELMQKAIETHEQGSYEQRFLRPDGSTGYYFSTYQGVFDNSGNLIAMKGTVQDITARKRAEEALRENRRQLATLMSNLPGMAYRCMNDRDWTMEFVSDGCYLLTGYKPEDLVGNMGTPYVELIHAEDRQMVWDSIQIALKEKRPFQLLYRIRTAGGEEKWVWEQGQGVFESNERVIALEGFITDITERKRAEQDLQRLTAILEATSDLVSISTLDKRVTYLNQAGRRLLGWAENQKLDGVRIPDIHPQWAVEKICEQGIPHAIEHGSWQGETAILGSDGQDIPVSQAIMVHKSPTGTVEYLSTIMRDITERKQAEQEREALLKALASKNEELESIIYVSSHDLRSPLINIEGFAGELKSSLDQIRTTVQTQPEKTCIVSQIEDLLTDNIPESLHFITAGVQKMSTLLDGLLRLCRLGRMPLEIQRIDGYDTFRTIIDAMQYQIDQAQATITLDSNIPPCLADPQQLNQVFTNLLDNAIKYRNPDQPLVIHITGRTEHGYTVYQITDNGKGIAPEYQQKIFEVFHRLNPNDNAGGEGLGLTIVKRLLDRLGGTIILDSQPDKGTTFYVTLPGA
ncbi:MAG: PAS domain S-box protein [Sedimentisphaerales bacterium]|nr:PAS domain S-box protein [Sedimentisphaerales bacterium]